MSEDKKQSFHDAYENFFEEITSRHEDHFKENLENMDPDSYDGGLTQENLRKLSEDLMNPMPPTDGNSH